MSSWVTKSYEDVLRIALALNFDAVELDCDEKPIPATQRSRAKVKEIFSRYPLRIFFHSPFLDQALGSRNNVIRQNTFNTLKMYLGFLEDLEASHLVIHAGVDDTECPKENVIEDVEKLVDIAESKSITLCVENLRFGLCSNPYQLRELVEECGSKIAFDLGHANSCHWTTSERRSPKDFLKIVENRVVAAHIYLKEEGGRHNAFTEINEVKETLDHLTGINDVVWWTIELPILEEVIKEKLMIDSYFKKDISTKSVL
jgi:sugar phosphate isomerase/epimerase